MPRKVVEARKQVDASYYKDNAATFEKLIDAATKCLSLHVNFAPDSYLWDMQVALNRLEDKRDEYRIN